MHSSFSYLFLAVSRIVNAVLTIAACSMPAPVPAVTSVPAPTSAPIPTAEPLPTPEPGPAPATLPPPDQINLDSATQTLIAHAKRADPTQRVLVVYMFYRRDKYIMRAAWERAG
jgi:hypothetical protein